MVTPKMLLTDPNYLCRAAARPRDGNIMTHGDLVLGVGNSTHTDIGNQDIILANRCGYNGRMLSSDFNEKDSVRMRTDANGVVSMGTPPEPEDSYGNHWKLWMEGPAVVGSTKERGSLSFRPHSEARNKLYHIDNYEGVFRITSGQLSPATSSSRSSILEATDNGNVVIGGVPASDLYDRTSGSDYRFQVNGKVRVSQLWFYPEPTTTNTVANLYIDDVEVLTPCVDNITYSAFWASPLISEASEYIYAYGTSSVSGAQTITYRAGEYIDLGADFTATPSGTGYFEAYIQPCNGYTIQSCLDNGITPPEKRGDHTQQQHNISAHAAVAVYPNPASDRAVIRYAVDSHSDISLSIVDIFGRTVLQPLHSIHRNNGEYTIDIDVASLPPGMYSVVLHIGHTRRQSHICRLIFYLLYARSTAVFAPVCIAVAGRTSGIRCSPCCATGRIATRRWCNAVRRQSSRRSDARATTLYKQHTAQPLLPFRYKNYSDMQIGSCPMDFRL